MFYYISCPSCVGMLGGTRTGKWGFFGFQCQSEPPNFAKVSLPPSFRLGSLSRNQVPDWGWGPALLKPPGQCEFLSLIAFPACLSWVQTGLFLSVQEPLPDTGTDTAWVQARESGKCLRVSGSWKGLSLFGRCLLFQPLH